MSNDSPMFPMTNEPDHFTDDYGFNPQFHYFQLLEEARKHKRENPPTETLHLKLPIRKIHSRTRKRWWKNALLFFGGNWASAHKTKPQDYLGGVVRPIRHRRPLSGPLYITESRSGSDTPYRTTSRPSSGQLMKRETDVIPYISLRDLNTDHDHHRISTLPMPIYLVT